MPIRLWDIRAEVPQFLLSQFLILDKFFIGKRKVKDYEHRVLTLVNLTPDYLKYPITRLLVRFYDHFITSVIKQDKKILR